MFALRHLFTHYYVILIFQIDDGRQMVTVTVQPSPAPMRTQGGNLCICHPAESDNRG